MLFGLPSEQILIKVICILERYGHQLAYKYLEDIIGKIRNIQ